MKKLRIFSIILCIVLVLSAFTSCDIEELFDYGSIQQSTEKNNDESNETKSPIKNDREDDKDDEDEDGESEDDDDHESESVTAGSTGNSTEDSTESREENTGSLNNGCDHTDTNNDGKCDECKVSVIVIFDLYAINDIHGKILDNDSQPGVDELTTYFKKAREKNSNTVIFSSGDMWQGTAESGLNRGQMMTDWMNELDFAFMTLGNHEFDWGEKYVEQNAETAEFPFLAINVYDSDTRQIADYCEPSIMVDLGDVQIGFIGAIGDCYSSISGDVNQGFYFLTGSTLTNLVKSEAQKLRAEGADFIVYSLHDETAGCDTSITLDGYVDIVFEGHSHQAYVKTDSNGAYHLQGGGENSGISYASVSFNVANNNSSVTAQVVKNYTYSSYPSDDIVDRLMEKYSDTAEMLNTSLGYNDTYRNSDYIVNLVAELYAELGETYWAEYDIVLGGGKISCRSPYYLGVGEVKYGDLYSLLTFDNRLALCSIKGSDLLSRYINSTSYNIAYTEYGNRVKDKIDSNATYYIITDSYNYTYSWNNLTVVEIYDDVTYARDLVAQYVKNGGMGSNVIPEAVTLTSIPNLLNIAKSLSAGGESADKYFVQGKIVEIVQTTYGNMYIEDENGNRLYVYGVNQNGVRYDGLTDKPQVGDTVILYGKMKNYVNGSNEHIYEMVAAELISK